MDEPTIQPDNQITTQTNTVNQPESPPQEPTPPVSPPVQQSTPPVSSPAQQPAPTQQQIVSANPPKQVQQAPIESQAVQEPEQKKSKWWIWAIVAAVVIGAGIGLYFWIF